MLEVQISLKQTQTMVIHKIPEVGRLCHKLFAGSLTKPQRENLGRSVAAVMQSHDGSLSQAARHFAGATKFRYRLKRLDRFIGNRRVKVRECWPALVPAILRLAVRLEGRIPVIVDHTDVGDIRICYAAVLFQQRALPLIFTPFWKNAIKVSQNRIEKDLLEELKELVPDKLKLVVVADRGFGRVSLFRFIKRKLKWSYVIRAKGDVWITGGAENDTLRRLPLVFWREKVQYQQKAKYRVNLVTCWTADKHDPWFLVTDLRDPDTVKTIYERRMRIEELFRDQKFHLGMRVPTARQLGRFARLLLVLFLAALLLLLLGAKVQRQPAFVAAVITTAADAGLLWLALQMLAYGSPGQVRRLLRQIIKRLAYV